MNVSQFTYLLQKPETISAEQTRELEIIIREYPYFQAARALQLKGLRLQDSFQYNPKRSKLQLPILLIEVFCLTLLPPKTLSNMKSPRK